MLKLKEVYNPAGLFAAAWRRAALHVSLGLLEGRAPPPDKVPSSGVSHHPEVIHPRLLLMSHKHPLLPVAV